MTNMMGYSTVRYVESFCVNPRRVQTVAAITVQTVLYSIWNRSLIAPSAQ